MEILIYYSTINYYYQQVVESFRIVIKTFNSSTMLAQRHILLLYHLVTRLILFLLKLRKTDDAVP